MNKKQKHIDPCLIKSNVPELTNEEKFISLQRQKRDLRNMITNNIMKEEAKVRKALDLPPLPTDIPSYIMT